MGEERRRRVVAFFEDFAGFAAGESPLYASLSRQIAADDDLIALTLHAEEHQPPANMLLGAVHYLLLRGDDHPLADWYRTVTDGPIPAANPFPAFKDFCLSRRDLLVPLLESRRVQTNEVRRAALLLPAFWLVARHSGLSLATVEVGASAGLLTVWDRYAYDYGWVRLGPARALVLECRLEPTDAVPGLALPPRAWSAGIDLHPVDVTDRDDADWLRGLVWPDQVERMRRLTAAIAVARSDPPNLLAGDGVTRFTELAERAPEGTAVVVHHSFALNQVSAEERAAFEERVASLAASRPTYLVAVEWVGGQDPAETFRLRWGRRRGGTWRKEELATVHHHGEWMRWAA